MIPRIVKALGAIDDDLLTEEVPRKRVFFTAPLRLVFALVLLLSCGLLLFNQVEHLEGPILSGTRKELSFKWEGETYRYTQEVQIKGDKLLVLTIDERTIKLFGNEELFAPGDRLYRLKKESDKLYLVKKEGEVSWEFVKKLPQEGESE